MNAISICIGRKGSKGLPGKNTLNINGKPMAYYPMNAAKNSKNIVSSYLSTDDPDLERIGNQLDHKYLKRPASLASGSALGEDVFAYAYKQIIDNEPYYKDLPVLLLFCNAPTISVDLIDEAISMLDDDKNIDSVVTVSRYNMWSPIRARKLDKESNLLVPFVPFEVFGNPKELNCDRDSQGDVLFANMSLSLVRPYCLEKLEEGLLPMRWMGKKIKPLHQDFGCDVDYLWQVPMVEYWLRNNYK